LHPSLPTNSKIIDGWQEGKKYITKSALVRPLAETPLFAA